MSEKVSPSYCDVSLPVPLDQLFTYLVPASAAHRIAVGARVLVPFAGRRLIGAVLHLHSGPPATAVKEIFQLLDEQPVFDAELLKLARWIAAYYCAPLGEVLRTMAPLVGETHHSRVWTLTDAGRDVARQLTHGSGEHDDPTTKVLRLLDARALSEPSLAKKVFGAARILRNFEKRAWAEREDRLERKDPLRSPSEKLAVEFASRDCGARLTKRERELLAYLELHPGPHNLAALETTLAWAGEAARALARRGCVKAVVEQPRNTSNIARPPHLLNSHQRAAYDTIITAIAQKQFVPILLHGVTGSGKTEIYLNAIETALAAGRGAMLLVPEIALTPQVAWQFVSRFGDRVAILHSAFNDTERAAQWQRIRAGEAVVVVGTRSAVFAPVGDLGLIVVDEEHDGSYKQEESPRYHGRDVAVVRAQFAGACVVMGSATPSLETRHNADKGKYTLVTLPERVENRPMPGVELIDMRIEFLETRAQSVFSRRLIAAIDEKLKAGEQVMLLLNRRGFSSFCTCRSCGHKLECVNCAVTLTYHRRDKRMLCHYCGYSERVPSVCPKCESEHVHFVGTGSEKVEEELHRHFAEARIARMDRDTVTGKHAYETILQGFREGSYDILVGTQMIAKGHDIPNVTLVGVVNADIGLGMPDFRAAERTFQLLTQAAGRAGRGALPGTVLIQTVNPEHYAVRFAAAQDYRLFYEKELQFRQFMRYPPFAALANIIVRHRSQGEAMAMAGELAAVLDPVPEGMKVSGPSEAAVPRLKREFRYQLLVKAVSRRLLGETLLHLRNFAVDRKWPATSLVIDVDPVSLL